MPRSTGPAKTETPAVPANPDPATPATTPATDAATTSTAADPANGTTPPAVAQDELAQQITSLQKQAAAAALPDETLKLINASVQEGLQALTRAKQYAETSDDANNRRNRVTEEVAGLQAQLEKLKSLPRPTVDKDATLIELDQQRVEEERQQAELQTKRTALVDQQKQWEAKRITAQTLLPTLEAEVAALKAKLATKPPEGEAPLLTNARMLENEAKQRAFEKQIASIRDYLAYYDAADAARWTQTQLDLIDAELERKQTHIDRLIKEISLQRQKEATDRVRMAQEQISETDVALKFYAVHTQEIAAEELNAQQELAAVQKKRESAERRLTNLEKDRANLTEKVASFNLTGPLAVRLRTQRSQLPNISKVRAGIAERFPLVEKAELAFFDKSEAKSNFKDVDSAVRQMLIDAGFPVPTEASSELRAQAQTLAEQRKASLESIVKVYDDLTREYVELDTTQAKLIDETQEFQSFIGAQVLWMRSHPPLTQASLADDRETLTTLANGEQWAETGNGVVSDVIRHPVFYSLITLGVICLLIGGQRLRRNFGDLAVKATAKNCIEFRPTLRALLITVVLSLMWPALFLVVGWRLSQLDTVPELSRNIGSGVMAIAGLFWALEFLRQVCRPSGLAVAHFDWPKRICTLVRSCMRGLIVFGIPLSAAVAVLNAYGTGHRSDLLERGLFIAGMLLLTFYLHRLSRPTSSLVLQICSHKPGGWFDKTRRFWNIVVLSIPLTLAALAALGYYYSATELTLKLQVTGWMLVGLLIVRELMSRWLMIRRRRLAMEQLRQRREMAAEASDAPSELQAAKLAEAADVQPDLTASIAQSQRLVGTSLAVCLLVGVWLIWADVLPAFNRLDEWPAFDTEREVTVITKDANGNEQTTTRTEEHPISYADLLVTLIFIVLTVTAARNIPGLLEMSVLDKLPLDSAVRFAASALFRYAIILVGMLLVADSLGIGWSQVQWLAAALTVGLGFGLQEIFANFISGVIILFEQPVRIGDIVTIDGTTGVVNRIRMRATTIMDWDRKEYIVPNKEFITGRLLNWTLSDRINRLVIEVGVAYASDPEHAHKVIKQAVEDHPTVMKDPVPSVVFDGFGDSSLNFTVRAFLPTLDDRLPTIHSLHTSIFKRLAEAGIEIPFPQRDLHVRSMVEIPRGAAGEGHYTNGASDPEAIVVAEN